MVAERARENDITLEYAADPDPLPDIWVDRVRLRQILLNLLTNAVKYNRAGGKVALSQQVTGNETMRITVADTGTGIEPESQADLFKPFNRLGRETGEIEGTGIGLAITESLVELLGGEIGFESEVDVGSAFWVDLPLAPPSALARTRPLGKAAGSYSKLQPEEQVVLYVEDNPANVELIAEIVAQFPDTEFISAGDGETAVELASQRSPDLIFMDINLPGIDGYEAMRRIHANAATRDIPIVALTAAAMPADVKKGMEAGFKKYLTKPIDINEVYEILSECCSADF
jgi:CheY-like chemotaxis protein